MANISDTLILMTNCNLMVDHRLEVSDNCLTGNIAFTLAFSTQQNNIFLTDRVLSLYTEICENLTPSISWYDRLSSNEAND